MAGEFLVMVLDPLPPRYNIAPGQAILVILGVADPLWEPEPKKTNFSESLVEELAEDGALRAVAGAQTPSRADLSTEMVSAGQAVEISGREPPIATPPGALNRQLVWMQWGFRPSGPSTVATGSLLVNLRAENAQQPRFRRLLETQRCLIPADGFYEWEKIAASRQPFFIHRKDDRPFGLAGLWKPAPPEQPWRLPECVVLTCPANRLIRPLHDRMPAILLPEHYSIWLNSAVTTVEQIAAVLHPYPEELLEIYPVSGRVNSAHYDQPDCIQRLDRPHQGRLFDPEKSEFFES